MVLRPCHSVLSLINKSPWRIILQNSILKYFDSFCCLKGFLLECFWFINLMIIKNWFLLLTADDVGRNLLKLLIFQVWWLQSRGSWFKSVIHINSWRQSVIVDSFHIKRSSIRAKCYLGNVFTRVWAILSRFQIADLISPSGDFLLLGILDIP